MCEKERINKKAHHQRDRIIEEGLLQYMERIKTSERNKQIVKAYVDGVGYKALADEYGITDNRIAQIINNYIRHCCLCRKNVRWYKDE